MAEQVAVVIPIANVDPDAGAQIGAIAPSTMSFALALNVATAPAWLVAFTVTLPDVVTIGRVVSTTLTWNVFVLEAVPHRA
ncbi:MAG TPA: hypothetical protein VGJ75_08100 [Dongiaceae bacterium]